MKFKGSPVSQRLLIPFIACLLSSGLGDQCRATTTEVFHCRQTATRNRSQTHRVRRLATTFRRCSEMSAWFVTIKIANTQNGMHFQ